MCTHRCACTSCCHQEPRLDRIFCSSGNYVSIVTFLRFSVALKVIGQFQPSGKAVKPNVSLVTSFAVWKQRRFCCSQISSQLALMLICQDVRDVFCLCQQTLQSYFHEPNIPPRSRSALAVARMFGRCIDTIVIKKS